MAKDNKNKAKINESKNTEQKENEVSEEKQKKTVQINEEPQPATEDTQKEDLAKSKTEQKYGFRLSPEEQELAYEVKASMMHKLYDQNASLSQEIASQRNLKTLRRQQQQQKTYASKTLAADNISPYNMKLLMKASEKKAKEAESQNKKLESELIEAKDLAKRYHDLYVAEKEKSSGGGTARKQSSKTRAEPVGGEPQSARPKSTSKEDRVTEDDLDDDEALFKRHVARIADTKTMKTISPIRVQDVIRKNEVLIEEHKEMRLEIERLKYDNAQLVRRVKESWGARDHLMHEISTTDAVRRDLSKRLEKEQRERQRLSKSLTQQASEWIAARREMQEMEGRRRFMMVGPMSTAELAAEERTFNHPVKKNVYQPRYMFPVEQYSGVNKAA